MSRTLAQDPGRSSTSRLLLRFVGMDARLALRRIGLRLGVISLGPVSSSDHAVPDTAVARAALELAREASPDFLLNHCIRTWCFAATLAARDRVRVDREALFVAAILHDLGLTAPLAAEPGSFEWASARAAHGLCVAHGMVDTRADLVHDAVALHTAVGVASRREPEVALVHLGAGCDLLGLRLGELPSELLAGVLENWPRLGFKDRFASLLADQAANKPESHIAGHVGLGLLDRMRAAPFAQ